MISVLLCVAASGITGVACAQTIPAGSATVFAEGDYGSFTVLGSEKDRVEITVREAADAAPVLLVRSEATGGSFPKIQARLNTAEALERGDVFLARFSMRALDSQLESGEVSVQFEVENAEDDAISTQFAAYAASQWQDFLVPVRLVRDAPAGAVAINFRVGASAQELELRSISVEQFPNGTKLSELPATVVRPVYEGMEADAPWRAQAQEAIRRNRMSPLEITVLSADGTPLAGAQVQVQQTRHAYWFGSAVRAGRLVGEQRRPQYGEAVKRLFNAVVLENDMKWSNWVRDPVLPLEAARWCAQNGVSLRGHTLVWASWRRVPAALQQQARGNPQALREIVGAHIDDITTATSEYVAAWDVLNEPFRHNELMQVLGQDEITEWFRRAHKGAPQSRLFVNDYGIVTGGGMDERHQDHYEQMARRLLEQQAPLHGLGMQGHFGRILTPPERMLAILDRYGRLGLEIQMTEYSTHVEDPLLAAEYLRDSLSVFFSHPATSGFMLWGFIDADSYKHTSVLLEADGETLTPAGKVWMDMIYNQWWTSETVTTDAQGRADLRVFNGEHEVALLLGGEPVATAQVSVGGGEPPARVLLTEPEPLVTGSPLALLPQ